jgi:hypothetical protein
MDFSTLYQIQVNEFYGIMFCGMSEESNEWSSTPSEDYLHITLLFTDRELCDIEYETMTRLASKFLPRCIICPN